MLSSAPLPSPWAALPGSLVVSYRHLTPADPVDKRRPSSHQAEDAELVAGGIAQICRVKSLFGFRRAKARRAFVAAAVGHAAGISGLDLLGRLALIGDHDAVAGACFLAVIGRADRGVAIHDGFAGADLAVAQPAALADLALAAERGKYRVVECSRLLAVEGPDGDIAD